MKHLKKLGSVLLALVMVLALAAPAFATPTTTTAPGGDGPVGDPGQGNDAIATGSITVKNAVEGASTTIYKIFDLEQYDRDTGAYLYKVNPAWGSFFTTGNGAEYVTIDASGYVSWKTGMDTAESMKAFVADAMAYAKTQPADLVSETKANNTGTPDNGLAEGELQTYTLTFDGLALGYWLVSSTDGTMCSLNTNAPNAVITNKNEVTKPGKTPGETSATVGQAVPFDITFGAVSTGIQYKVTDTIKKGLTMTEAQFAGMTITVGGETVTATTITGEPTEAQLAGSSVLKRQTATGFEIYFPKGYVSNLTDKKNVVIHYEMTVTDEAIVEKIENDVKLDYGDGFTVEGDEVKVEVPTYCFSVVKLNGNDKKVISGAEFELYDVETGGTPIKLVKMTTAGTAHTGGTEHSYQYRIATPKEIEANASEDGEITTKIEAGNVTVAGLKSGAYYLEETKVPDGYNGLKERQEFTIANADLLAANTAVGEVFDTVNGGGVQVENKTGTLLPSTGGIGTTIFYIVGGVLVLGAVVLLITKRRTSVDDE